VAIGEDDNAAVEMVERVHEDVPLRLEYSISPSFEL
jgi:hypothetical protein